MTNKILTVAICAYNMEKYIERALDSCIVDNMDKIEVLIMNDGSKDKTAELSMKYCEMYPDTFKLVDKENGGWGSNLNMAVKMANGKYFKNLDADDWFDKDNFQKFINLLEEKTTDLVLSVHRYCYEEEWVKDEPAWKNYFGKEIKQREIDGNWILPIWDVTFLTDLVKKYHKDLPNHTLYTDTLYTMQLLMHTDSIYVSELIVYNYLLGRDEQSVNINVVKKHYKDYLKVLDIMLDIYDSDEMLRNNILARKRLIGMYNVIVRNMLNIYSDKEIGSINIIKKYEKKIKEEFSELYHEMNEIKLFKMIRMTRYKGITLINKYLGMK